jgi:beta-phosphoglucomutase
VGGRPRVAGAAGPVTDAAARRAAIFDMDGVLIDSEPYHHAAWRRICLEDGVSLTLAQVAELTLGRPVRESLPALLARPVDADEIERLTRRKAAFYEEASGGVVREVRGATRFARGLTVLGVRCALATSARLQRVEPILHALQLADQLRVRVTGDDVERGKPDPEVYLTAAARLHITPGACVVFADAPVGVVAARLAGMPVVGVATSCHADELEAAGARMVVRDFTGLSWVEVAALG